MFRALKDKNFQIGKKLKKVRNKSNVKISDLAIKHDLSISYLSKIERGNIVVPAEIVFIYSQQFKQPLEWFFTDNVYSEPFRSMDYIRNQNVKKSLTALIEQIIRSY